MSEPLTVSWLWLKRSEGKRTWRFVVSTHPYSEADLVRLGRTRWAIEGFFKTIKHRFGWHRFGQSTKLGVYRWLVLSMIASLLTPWMEQWSYPPVLDWKAASDFALEQLFPSVLWLQRLKQSQTQTDLAAWYRFEITLESLPDPAYRAWCKI